MTRKSLIGLAVVTGALVGAVTTMRAQNPQSQQQSPPRAGRDQLPQPVYRVAQQTPDSALSRPTRTATCPSSPSRWRSKSIRWCLRCRSPMRR